MSAIPPTAATSSVAPPIPTLADLFSKQDFSNVLRANTDFPITDQKGKILVIKVQLYLDFQGKNTFVGFYVPHTPAVFDACAYLADHCDIPLSLGKNVPSGGRVGEITKYEDLVFSGRVYLYHEDELSDSQKGKLSDLYASKHLEVKFRGTQYWLLMVKQP